MWLVVLVVLAAVILLAGWLFDVGLWWGPVALVGSAALTSLLIGLGSALTARIVGIRLSQVEIGLGRLVGVVPLGATRLLLRPVPVLAAWVGSARRRNGVRWRFWSAHLGGLLAAGVLLAVMTTLPDGDARRGALVGAALVLILAFLPMTDEYGHGAPGWQLLTIPFLPDSAMNGWFESEPVSAARLAADEGDFGRAEELLRAAVVDDPDEMNAWMKLSSVLLDTGRFVEAADVTSQALARPGLAKSSRIGWLNNHAWALLVATEAGTPVEGWRDKSRRALDGAAELAGPGNAHLMSTEALYEALDGNAHFAVSMARAALDGSFDDDGRVEEMLTLAIAVSRVDGDEAAGAWLQKAVDLKPKHPRIPGVRRLVAGPEVSAGSP
jgi:Flp pilus assembly protein TadD